MKHVLFVLALLMFAAPVAQAHTLSKDGTIGAVMHIDPDDQPIAGTLSNLYFDMKDTTGRFAPAACECTLLVTQDGTQLTSQSVTQSGSTTLASTFTFPSIGVYRVELLGMPSVAGAFDAFTITYNVRVDRGVGAMPPAQGSRAVLFFGVSAAVTCAIVVLCIFYFVKRKPHA
jgi:hypothetical protein